MKRFKYFSALMLLCLLMSIPIYANDSKDLIVEGSDYELLWTLDSSGKLTVTNTAGYVTAMHDYNGFNMPWYDVFDDIQAVELIGFNSIGAYAFCGCEKLESLYSETPISKIGNGAFADCPNLKKFDVCIYGFSVYEIGKNAFANCSALQAFTFKRDTTIDAYAFGNCTGLQSIYFCTSDDTGTFSLYNFKSASDSFQHVDATVYYPTGCMLTYDAKNLSSGGNFTWKESYAGICGAKSSWNFDPQSGELFLYGDGALNTLSSGNFQPWSPFKKAITSVMIADGLEILPSYTFEYLESLEKITLPQTLKKIACNAFNDCANLNNLLIPQSVTELTHQFNRCSSLHDVYYLGDRKQWEKVIGQETATATITVHTLRDQSISPTCIYSGTEAYYAFENSTVYSGIYDEQGHPISSVIKLPPLGHDFSEDDLCKNGCGVVYEPIRMEVHSVEAVNPTTYSYKVTVISNDTPKGSLIVAAYDKLGRFIGFGQSPIAFEICEGMDFNRVSVSGNVLLTGIPLSYKVFFWESLSTCVPFAEAVGNKLS